MNPVFLSIAVFSVLFTAGSASAQSAISAVASPAFPTSPPTRSQVRVEEVFPYTERVANPSWPVPYVVAGSRSQDTAIDTLVARVAAMQDGDYAAWLALWDSRSQQRVQDENQRTGRTEQFWTGWWRDLLQTAVIRVVREIRTGEYVVLTYRVEHPIDPPSRDELEMPMALKQDDGRWVVTQDLSADSLLDASPWVSGSMQESMVVR